MQNQKFRKFQFNEAIIEKVELSKKILNVAENSSAIDYRTEGGLRVREGPKITFDFISDDGSDSDDLE